MGRNLVLVELTRAHAGSEVTLVRNALAAMPDPLLVVVGLEAQRNLLEETDCVFVPTDGYDTNVQEAVATAITEHGGDADSLTVYSFNPSIVSGRSTVINDLVPAPQIVPGNRLVNPGRTDDSPRKSEDRFAWPNQLIPLPEALELLRDVLDDHGAATRSVLKTNIRPWLQTKSKAFDAESGLPGARTPTLMGRLLHHAEAAGMVEQTGSDPAVSVLLLQPNRDAKRSGDRGEAKASETRSERFQTILLNGIGLYPDVREALLENIEHLHKAQAGQVTAGQVIKQAVKKTKDESPEFFPRKNKDDLPKEKFPWRKVEGFALMVLSRAGLIVDAEGKPDDSHSPWRIRNGFLGDFSPEWKTLVDAELIMELVVENAGVGWNDGVDLAGALWCDRDEKYVQRVDMAIDALFSSNRVTMSARTSELEPIDQHGRHRQTPQAN